MKKIVLAFLMLLFFTACSKDYPYADRMLDFYEEIIDQYEDAESVEELNDLRGQARQLKTQIEEELQESHEELIRDMEEYDEDAYLVHLRILSAESYAGFMYVKRKYDIQKENKF